MVHSRDARLLGRLRTGLPVTDADLTDASGEFRPIAARILAAPLSDRLVITDHWLAGYAEADAEAIKLAVIHTDPAPPPEALASREEALARSLGLDVRMTRASEIAPRPVDWLWRGRVPLGMLTMFAGDPKLGKSFVALSVAAAVSRGAPLPGDDVPTEPASAIVLSAEDDPARTIVPRLIAAGADLPRVHILKSVILDNRREAPPRLDIHLAALVTAIERVGDCRLVLIDPITAYLGQVDDHRNADLRSVLSPLNDLAERLRVAVVLVSHLSKGSGTNGKHRVLGSIAYVGTCRANFLFVRDRTDPTGRRVLFCDNGGNLGPAAATLAYTIEEREHGGARRVPRRAGRPDRRTGPGRRGRGRTGPPTGQRMPRGRAMAPRSPGRRSGFRQGDRGCRPQLRHRDPNPETRQGAGRGSILPPRIRQERPVVLVPPRGPLGSALILIECHDPHRGPLSGVALYEMTWPSKQRRRMDWTSAGTPGGLPAEAGFDPSHPASAPGWLGSSPQGDAPRGSHHGPLRYPYGPSSSAAFWRASGNLPTKATLP